MNLSNCWIGLAAGTLMLVAGLSLAAAPASGPAATSVRIYVGTYTNGKSKGIYTLTMNPATGALSAPEVAAETSNPSFLAADPSGKFLYAVNETGNFGGGKTGSVSAFAVTADTSRLTAVGQPQTSAGAAPCHVVVSPSGKNVVVANYGSGTVAVLPVVKDGALGSPSAVIQHQGTGPNRGRQEGPHAHCVGFDPSGKILLVADLGADKIFLYRWNEAAGGLSPAVQPFAAAINPGAGPRHFAFSPSGKFLYVVNELASTVGVYAYDAARGSLAAVQSVSTLAGGGGGSAAEIAVHPSGKFVYASTRGANTIAIFAADADTGKLTPVGHEPTQGGGPRHFAIDQAGTFLVVANQDAGNLVVFKIDPATGKLQATGAKASVPSPVCVTFMPLNK